MNLKHPLVAGALAGLGLVAAAPAFAVPSRAVSLRAEARALATSPAQHLVAADASRPSGVRVDSATYADATGDSKSAPDIATTLVTSDPATGLLTFELDFANQDDLSRGGVAFVAIDADRNRATGDRLGADYAIGATENGGAFLKWNGAGFGSFAHLP